MLAAAAKSLQSCLTLYNPIDGSPPDSSIPGILQARILEWVAISFSNACMHTKSLQSYPTLCDPMDSSPPGSSVHGILPVKTYARLSVQTSPHSKDTSHPALLLLLISRFSRVRLCATPWTAAHQAPLSTGLSRLEWVKKMFTLPHSLQHYSQ